MTLVRMNFALIGSVENYAYIGEFDSAGIPHAHVRIRHLAHSVRDVES